MRLNGSPAALSLFPIGCFLPCSLNPAEAGTALGGPGLPVTACGAYPWCLGDAEIKAFVGTGEFDRGFRDHERFEFAEFQNVTK